VKDAIPDRDFKFGPDYIIPTPFDPRLITELPVAIAKAAIDSGVTEIKTLDENQYKVELTQRLGVTEGSQ
jgi:malate dehydrogenase (oxaloacetate-decarboxylating)(NADP+)